jgi:hypothetical protein
MGHAIGGKHREIVHDTLPWIPLIGRGDRAKGSWAALWK